MTANEIKDEFIEYINTLRPDGESFTDISFKNNEKYPAIIDLCIKPFLQSNRNLYLWIMPNYKLWHCIEIGAFGIHTKYFVDYNDFVNDPDPVRFYENVLIKLEEDFVNYILGRK